MYFSFNDNGTIVFYLTFAKCAVYSCLYSHYTSCPKI